MHHHERVHTPLCAPEIIYACDPRGVLLMDDSETSSVTWGRKEIPYTIRRDTRREFPGFSVLPCGTVELRAPMHLDTVAADALAAQEASWIVQRLEGVVCLYTAAPYEFVTGESLSYLGGEYRLKVLPGETRDMMLRNGWLRVPVREGKQQAGRVRAALVAWFRAKAEARLPERVEAWREAVGVPMPPVVIANQRKHLGNCDRNGTIRLNWRLIQAPGRLMDYVIVHQLVHLLHRGHGPEYWKAFERVMDDCHYRREALNRERAALFW